MPIEIAALVDRQGNVHSFEGTGSHDVLIDRFNMRVADGVELEHFARIYYMAVNPSDFFDPDQYVLMMRGARHVRRNGLQAMQDATDRERPGWFDDDMWFAVEDKMSRLLEDKLNGDPVIVNNFLDMRHSTLTELPRLYVRNGVQLEYSSIERFGDHTKIAGHLYASRCPFSHFEHLTIGENEGILHIEGRKDITSLPDSLQIVNGVIRAAGSGLTMENVPEHLRSKIRGIH